VPPAVATTQAVTLTATAGGTSQTFNLQVQPANPSLAVSSSSVTFGNVVLNTPSTQVVTLTSNGAQAVTISSASIAGAGFSISGATFPLTLNPAQTANLTVQFDPTATGAATGQLTLTATLLPDLRPQSH